MTSSKREVHHFVLHLDLPASTDAHLWRITVDDQTVGFIADIWRRDRLIDSLRADTLDQLKGAIRLKYSGS